MDLGLQGKTVLVTGGASGIGPAISLLLAGEGTMPAILGHDPADEACLHALTRVQPRASFFQVGRSAFHDRARTAFALVATGERRL